MALESWCIAPKIQKDVAPSRCGDNAVVAAKLWTLVAYQDFFSPSIFCNVYQRVNFAATNMNNARGFEWTNRRTVTCLFFPRPDPHPVCYANFNLNEDELTLMAGISPVFPHDDTHPRTRKKVRLSKPLSLIWDEHMMEHKIVLHPPAGVRKIAATCDLV